MLKIILTLAFVVFFAKPSMGSDDFKENFEAYIKNETLTTLTGAPLYKEDLMAFYAGRNFKPVWYDEYGARIENIENYKDAILDQAYLNGLDPQDYELGKILNALGPKPSGDAFFEREWMLTNSVMHYINDIRTGRIKPHRYDPMIFLLPSHRALDLRMESLLKATDKSEFLQSLAPQQPEYIKLREKLAQYLKLASQGGWPTVELKQGELIYPGDAHDAVVQIRQRLDAAFHEYDGLLPEGVWVDNGQIAVEELSDRIAHQDIIRDKKDEELEQVDPALIYDSKLALKVAEFQYFHGLKADAVVGPETLSVLNRPVERQIEKIKLAMERWRWLPDDLGEKHIQLNLASFRARAVENGKDELVIPIIVGQVAHQTPIFSSVIENIKFHPDWTAPSSIARRYLISKIQNNPAIIDRLGYQLIERQSGQIVPWNSVNIENLHNIDLGQYVFRQKPSLNNALGLARFSIDNDYAIFMHGTPGMKLFNEDERTYSSGCIRLEDPLAMALFLMDGSNTSDSEIEELYYVDEGEFPDTTFVDLKEDVPVHLTYMTAWVDEGGHLHFAEDVYGRDEKLLNAFTRLN